MPGLRLSATRLAQAQDSNEVLERLLPKTITVLPRARLDEDNTKDVSATKMKPATTAYYEVTEAISVDNVPFKIGGKLKPAM